MRVLFVAPSVPWPLSSGGRIRTFHLVREASALAEVHLLAVREPGSDPRAEEALRPHCASLRLHERGRPGLLARATRSKLERWFHSPALAADLARELGRGGVDLVHLDELSVARALPRDGGRGRARVPLVQHHHKLDTVLYERLADGAGPAARFDLWKLRRLEALAARRTPHHVLCSREDAEILCRRHGPLEVAVVPSGFDPGTFRPSTAPPERERSRLLFLGSLDYGPNVDGLRYFTSEVLPRIRQERSHVRLQVVGRAPLPEVRALASESVEVVGEVADVVPWLERAGALVVPLRIGGGTRLKIVEALALATPVVSTRVGAEGLELEDGRHLLLADARDELARAALRLIDDPPLARRLGESGRAFVHERYRWETLARELVLFWQRAAAGSRS